MPRIGILRRKMAGSYFRVSASFTLVGLPEIMIALERKETVYSVSFPFQFQAGIGMGETLTAIYKLVDHVIKLLK